MLLKTHQIDSLPSNGSWPTVLKITLSDDSGKESFSYLKPRKWYSASHPRPLACPRMLGWRRRDQQQIGSFRRRPSPDVAEFAQSHARGTPRPPPGLFSCWATRTGPWPQGSPPPLCSGHPLRWGHTKHSLALVPWVTSKTPCYLSLILGWPDDQLRCRFS